MMRRDNYILGVLMGLLMPFLGFFGFYEYRFSLFSIQEFLELLNQQKSLLSAMISISLLINGAVLTFFFQKQQDKTAKGIFFSTCIYAIIAIACKWFL
jgi:predicted membrane channel-forming protein YqfA (hemolysin III family)